MNDKPKFPVDDPDPWWFKIIWIAAVVLTIFVCDMIPKGIGQ